MNAPAVTAPASDLAFYAAAKSALAKARTVDEVMQIHDAARRMRANARIAEDRSLIADAVEIQMRAERRLGEEIGQAKAERRIAEGRPKNCSESEQFRLRLDDLGIDRKLSMVAQRTASLDAETFEAYLGETRIKIESRGARALNPQGDALVRANKEQRRARMDEMSRNPLLLPRGPWARIVADPPWIDEDAPLGVNGRHYLMHYELMTVDEIAAMPVADIIGPIAVMMLWITPYHVAIGSHLKVLAAWRLTPRTIVTWDKEIAGLGKGFVRHQSEHIIVATRGDVPAPDDADRSPSLFAERRSSLHSEKPDWPERQLERWKVRGPGVVLFERGPARAGWKAWGNEATVATW